jgi:O-acetyl-ADP-ribose deacetylase (regulator of RNase III)
MIESVQGDLLRSRAMALVNTVNTAGVMGKGVALQFKHAYPDNYKAYVAACKQNQVRIGQMFIFDRGLLDSPRYIINFPTKKHWRHPSKLEYITAGLEDLAQQVKALGIQSIAVPPLGAGNGGLEWSMVLPLILKAFSMLPDVQVLLFEPQPLAVHELIAPLEKPKLTVGRAALIKLFALYTALGEGIGRLEAQKLAYFLQESGLVLKLPFVEQQFGPYADNLNHVLQRLEGTYIEGYADRNTRSLIHVLPNALDEAIHFLADHSGADVAISQAMQWVEGFESPYGLELLATVHWAVCYRNAQDFAEVQHIVKSWNERKAALPNSHLEAAWLRVQELTRATVMTNS